MIVIKDVESVTALSLEPDDVVLIKVKGSKEIDKLSHKASDFSKVLPYKNTVIVINEKITFETHNIKDMIENLKNITARLEDTLDDE